MLRKAEKIALDVLNNIKGKSSLYVGKLKEKISQLNIKENTVKITNIFKNYNYKNILNDTKLLLKKGADDMVSAIGSDKCVSFVSKMSFGKVNIASACVLAFFVASAALASDLDFGYRIICNGKTVAITAKRETALIACKDAKKELALYEGSEMGNIKVAFTVANKEMFQNEDYAVNAVVAAFDGKQGAYGIYADGILVVALNSEEEAKEALNSYKDEFKKEGVIETDFNKNVEILQARVKKGSVKNKEEALAALKLPAGGVKVHEVSEGETIYQIAVNYGTSEAKLMALNPGISPSTLQIGAKLNVSDNTPVIAVRTKEHSKEIEKIAYETNKVEDKNTYKGITIVVSDGQYGEKEVDYDVYRENGVVTKKVATNENILKNPVTKQVKVGSKQRPASAPTGSFMNPFAAGIVSSRYGGRSRGYHTGIDLAGKSGSPVYASDGGTVTFAGWNGGYGKMIKINHGNGYETYYAHLSSINVKNGAKVAKGTLIGKVGNTGNSTGPHLHFEIRKNGQTLNPGSFIGR